MELHLGQEMWNQRNCYNFKETRKVDCDSEVFLSHPELTERDLLRHEYNFRSESLMIRCMPLPTPDSLSSQERNLATVGSGIRFTGDPSGRSEKLSDAYVCLPRAQFSTVVWEASSAEDHEQLVQDARLCLLRTSGQGGVVIVLSFQENIPPAPAVVRDDETTTKILPMNKLYSAA
ncbi:hypothetical protein HOY82DRAFT_537151 [Tuber indicum]|nr:hypothetical protein HOY82DRAFT_537151 [Tuber indicum]